MHFEHLVYSVALAIIIGGIYSRYSGIDISWIIIAGAYVPDIDHFIKPMLNKLDMTYLIYVNPISKGDFHNITAMLLFALIAALFLQWTGIRFRDAFFFANIGFMAHLIEDGLVYNPAYEFFWPFSADKTGLGILEYHRNFYGIANTETLAIGLMAVMMCGIVRMKYQGNDWVRGMFIPDSVIFFSRAVYEKGHLSFNRLVHEGS